MGPPSYMRSVVDRNVIMRLMTLCDVVRTYRGADKSLTRLGRKQATATEDFDVHISYL
jgi:hypothetical protein